MKRRILIFFLIVFVLLVLVTVFDNSQPGHRLWKHYVFSNPTQYGWDENAPARWITSLIEAWELVRVMFTFGDPSMATAMWIIVVGVFTFSRR